MDEQQVVDDFMKFLQGFQNLVEQTKQQVVEVYSLLLEIQVNNLKTFGFEDNRTQRIEYMLDYVRKALDTSDLNERSEAMDTVHRGIQEYHKLYGEMFHDTNK